MTVSEAIEKLKNMRLFMHITDENIEHKFPQDYYKANEMAIQELEEVQQYRAIGTPEECRAAVEKQIPKKPKSTHIKYGKHTWAKKENGEIDDFAWDYEYHNGVVCEVCGKTVCVHCNPQYDRLTDCEDEYYNCPSCGKKIFSAYKYCDCGQKIDWSDEE